MEWIIILTLALVVLPIFIFAARKPKIGKTNLHDFDTGLVNLREAILSDNTILITENEMRELRPPKGYMQKDYLASILNSIKPELIEKYKTT